MEEPKRNSKDYYISLIKRHKLAALGILVVVTVVLFGFLSLFLGMMSGSMYSRSLMASDTMMESLSYKAAPGGMSSQERQVDSEAGKLLSEPQSEYKIKRGSAGIKSTDAMGDFDVIKQKAGNLDGWVETQRKSENYREISMVIGLKIPVEGFDSFADWLMGEFDVETSNLELYRVSVEKQQDEMQILLEALAIYGRLMGKAEALSVTKDTLDVVMAITERKLDVMRLLRQYGYSVEEVKEKAEYSSLSITLTQKKSIELVPDDIWRDLRAKLRDSIREITDTAIDLVTVPVVILARIILWILYAVVIIIPAFVAYKLLMRIFRWINRKL